MMRIAPEGKPILVVLGVICAGCVICAVILKGAIGAVVGVLGSLPLIFSLWFFRDPDRQPPGIAGAVVAPADGKIIAITVKSSENSAELEGKKLSIFMSPFNVHVNRIPIGGRIKNLQYNRGRFISAFHDKASIVNEQQFIEIETQFGAIGCVQIAGWLARRIVCNLQIDQMVSTGEKFGMIRFGSRLDLHLPLDCSLNVVKGQEVRAGETIIGVLHEKN